MTLSTRQAGLFAALAAAVALAVALGSERWIGLVPCPLCLIERWPYRIALGLSLGACLLPPAFARTALAVAVVAFLVGAGSAFLHVGVEQGLWPSPLPECAAPALRGGDFTERLAAMPLTPSKPCDEPTYLIPAVPVSMAAMNLLYALAASLGLSMFLVGSWRRPR